MVFFFASEAMVANFIVYAYYIQLICLLFDIEMKVMLHDFDYIIIGSGFGGSVSALRLSEKGYKVLVIEKGKWYTAKDFAKTNWNLGKWLWMPYLRFFGIMKMSIFT